MHIFLDESGDLGFNFNDKKPSNHFIITLLVCDDQNSAKHIKKSVEKTLKNKLHQKNKPKNRGDELKGANTLQNIKTYFFKQAIKNNAWSLYTIILDKRKFQTKLKRSVNIHRIYNIIANHLLEQVNFTKAETVNLFVDKSKNRAGIHEFDTMLQASLNTILPLTVPINITHISSEKSFGVQAADLFCWGIFRKYEQKNSEWYRLFEEKIVCEQKFIL